MSRQGHGLADPPSRGTLSLAYRRSVVALQSALGWSSSETEQAEREALIPDSHQQSEGFGNAASVAGPSGTTGSDGYGSVLDLPPERRVPRPKPVKSAVRVEAKVWFANERTWISWLRVSVLLGSFSLALFNSAGYFAHRLPDTPGGTPGPEVPEGPNASTIRNFGIVYAAIAVATLLWGLWSYQRRVTLIKRRYAGDFDDLVGPPLICIALFIAVLVNFIVRVQEHNAL
ncbi:Component of vacuolar transporter chaperone (Vtc) involved in vacuole fusion [Ceraceosorus bombacis]|uniref:Component of vacuolar transporter chaperone (Vtc) involved in vacuole fusion n=1 Tax=Ceraceosorus bombacis TaxID=401625 RepID=A0A0P1BCK7_9BASI|nr:Component of vacuolar transporter chaperone (Vtc) involved in vacuole fusion [Ceraceosorus bombacis]